MIERARERPRTNQSYGTYVTAAARATTDDKCLAITIVRDVILHITADAPPQNWISVFPACLHVLRALMLPEFTQNPKTGSPPSSRNYVPLPRPPSARESQRSNRRSPVASLSP